jgi:hypothetical protein
MNFALGFDSILLLINLLLSICTGYCTVYHAFNSLKHVWRCMKKSVKWYAKYEVFLNIYKIQPQTWVLVHEKVRKKVRKISCEAEKLTTSSRKNVHGKVSAILF